MSKTDALLDGIERVYNNNGVRGYYEYRIPCQMCGTIVTKRHYRTDIVTLCDYCKAKINHKRKEKAKLPDDLLAVKTKADVRFDKAVKRISKQVDNINSYQNAINIAKTKSELYGSIPETMVAIELIHLKYKIIPQQKVGRYRVDFAIPSEKIVIEVDGSLYHKDVNKGDREATIQFSLGLDWKIIHIPAEMIEKDITKLKNIIDVFYKSKV